MFNNKDFIYRKRAAYSQEGCDYAIRFFEKRVDLHHEGSFGDALPDHKIKKCTEIYLKRNEYTLFEDALQGCLKDYLKIYPSCKHVERWDLDLNFKLQRYKPNEGYFGEHCENGGVRDSLYRVLAWMVYLNDVTDGGYTVFPNQNRKFQPRRGDILVWPSYFTHTHYGVTSKTQMKYIATGWCSVITKG
mgnify:FL=1